MSSCMSEGERFRSEVSSAMMSVRLASDGVSRDAGMMSSGRISTTMPELLQRPPRLEGLMPLTTICSGPLAAGTTTPPGHMQKLYTPRPSAWRTMLYSAAGSHLPRPSLE